MTSAGCPVSEKELFGRRRAPGEAGPAGSVGNSGMIHSFALRGRLSPGSYGVRAPALFRRLVTVRQVVGGIDQRDMREGLRKVPNLPSPRDVILLRQQPDIVAKGQQTLEQRLGVALLPRSW